MSTLNNVHKSQKCVTAEVCEVHSSMIETKAEERKEFVSWQPAKTMREMQQDDAATGWSDLLF